MGRVRTLGMCLRFVGVLWVVWLVAHKVLVSEAERTAVLEEIALHFGLFYRALQRYADAQIIACTELIPVFKHLGLLLAPFLSDAVFYGGIALQKATEISNGIPLQTKLIGAGVIAVSYLVGTQKWARHLAFLPLVGLAWYGSTQIEISESTLQYAILACSLFVPGLSSVVAFARSKRTRRRRRNPTVLKQRDMECQHWLQFWTVQWVMKKLLWKTATLTGLSTFLMGRLSPYYAYRMYIALLIYLVFAGSDYAFTFLEKVGSGLFKKLSAVQALKTMYSFTISPLITRWRNVTQVSTSLIGKLMLLSGPMLLVLLALAGLTFVSGLFFLWRVVTTLSTIATSAFFIGVVGRCAADDLPEKLILCRGTLAFTILFLLFNWFEDLNMVPSFLLDIARWPIFMGLQMFGEKIMDCLLGYTDFCGLVRQSISVEDGKDSGDEEKTEAVYNQRGSSPKMSLWFSSPEKKDVRESTGFIKEVVEEEVMEEVEEVDEVEDEEVVEEEQEIVEEEKKEK